MHAVEHYHITNNVRHCHVHCAYFIILYRTASEFWKKQIKYLYNIFNDVFSSLLWFGFTFIMLDVGTVGRRTAAVKFFPGSPFAL